MPVRVWADSVTDCICYANGSVFSYTVVAVVYTSSWDYRLQHIYIYIYIHSHVCVRVASCYIFKRCVSTVQIKLRSISRLFGPRSSPPPPFPFLYSSLRPLASFTIMVTFCMLIKCMQNYANFPGVFECNALKVFEFFISTIWLGFFFLYNEILFFSIWTAWGLTFTAGR